MDGQAADHQRLAATGRAHAAHDGADVRHDDAGGEGLDDVIIRTNVQPQDAVRIFISGGDHQDGHLRDAADAAADLKAVDAGQHDIQQDQRGRGGVKQGQRLLAGGGGQVRPALRADVLGENFQNLFVVVHDENGVQAKSLR